MTCVLMLCSTQTGRRLNILDSNAHTEPVSALEWLPDGTGFLSGGLDRKIILWVCLIHMTLRAASNLFTKNAEGQTEGVWLKTAVRITDLALAPDLSRIVVVGLESLPVAAPKGSVQTDGSNINQPPPTNAKENRIIIYNFSNRVQEACVNFKFPPYDASVDDELLAFSCLRIGLFASRVSLQA